MLVSSLADCNMSHFALYILQTCSVLCSADLCSQYPLYQRSPMIGCPSQTRPHPPAGGCLCYTDLCAPNDRRSFFTDITNPGVTRNCLKQPMHMLTSLLLFDFAIMTHHFNHSKSVISPLSSPFYTVCYNKYEKY